MSAASTENDSSTVHGSDSWFCWILVSAVLAGTLMRLLGRWSWLCELATHFTVQAVVGALLASAILSVKRRREWALICLVLAIVNSTDWVMSWLPLDRTTTSASRLESLVVASANVYSRNRNAAALRIWLDEIQPDVVVVTEVDPWWAVQIDSWKADWPHQIVRPQGDNFGIALISRHPIQDFEVTRLELEIPAIRARIAAPSGEWTVVGLHMLPPGGRRTAIRDRQLQQCARWIRELARPRIVVGDLNTGPGSPAFTDFVRGCDLKDSRRGFGWQASWPAHNPLLRIPIDHCLVEPESHVLSRNVGPAVGSDHFPIWARISRGR